MEELSVVAN